MRRLRSFIAFLWRFGHRATLRAPARAAIWWRRLSAHVRLISIRRSRRGLDIGPRDTGCVCVCYVTVMVFITGVCLLLQTTTTRSTANAGEMQTPQADGDKKKRKPKIVRNLKVISPVHRKKPVSGFLARLCQEMSQSHGGLKRRPFIKPALVLVKYPYVVFQFGVIVIVIVIPTGRSAAQKKETYGPRSPGLLACERQPGERPERPGPSANASAQPSAHASSQPSAYAAAHAPPGKPSRVEACGFLRPVGRYAVGPHLRPVAPSLPGRTSQGQALDQVDDEAALDDAATAGRPDLRPNGSPSVHTRQTGK